MHTQHIWAGDRNCSHGYKYIMHAYDTSAAASFRHTPRSGVSSFLLTGGQIWLKGG